MFSGSWTNSMSKAGSGESQTWRCPSGTWLCSFTAHAREKAFSRSLITSIPTVQIYNRTLVTQNFCSLNLVPDDKVSLPTSVTSEVKTNQSPVIFEMGSDLPATTYFPFLR